VGEKQQVTQLLTGGWRLGEGLLGSLEDWGLLFWRAVRGMDGLSEVVGLSKAA